MAEEAKRLSADELAAAAAGVGVVVEHPTEDQIAKLGVLPDQKVACRNCKSFRPSPGKGPLFGLCKRRAPTAVVMGVRQDPLTKKVTMDTQSVFPPVDGEQECEEFKLRLPV